MKNAEKFKTIFGLYATELWAMDEERMLKWLNAECEEPERKVGHWMPKGPHCFECDQCGELVSINVYTVEKASDRFKFCPACGSDMRGGQK